MGQRSSTLGPVVQTMVDNPTTVISIQNNEFWEQIWTSAPTSAEYIVEDISAEAIRTIKKECPKNVATLIRRAVLKMRAGAKRGMAHPKAQQQVTAATRILTRVIPYLFEDNSWDGFWWTPTPVGVVVDLETHPFGPHEGWEKEDSPDNAPLLAHTLIDSILDLLFAPGYTAPAFTNETPKKSLLAVPLWQLELDDVLWYPGVDFTESLERTANIDVNRGDLLRLLLVCLSHPLYTSPANLRPHENNWLEYLTSDKNEKSQWLAHALVNTFIGYDPIGMGIPYNHILMPDDEREGLAELSGEVLAVIIDYTPTPEEEKKDDEDEKPSRNVISRWIANIRGSANHKFLIDGFDRLFNTPLQPTWLPRSQKRVTMYHELMVLLWKLCDTNAEFLASLLKSPSILSIIVPVLHHINEVRLEYSQVGLLHIGIYILLLLSGERNFAVRLNKKYDDPQIEIDVPTFSGNYGDLLILVLHNLLVCENTRLTPLYDCLLTIIANISPYLKSVGLVAANKLVHLVGVFSTPKFLFAEETNHHLIFYLLETLNNLIQYQFEGNTHLVYVLIRRRSIIHRLDNLQLSTFETAKATAAADSIADKDEENLFAPESNELDLAQMRGKHEAEPKGSKETLVKASVQENDPKEHFTVVESETVETDEVKDVTKDIILPSPEKKSGAFTPSQGWLNEWHDKLPLDTVRRLLQILVPQVEKLCSDKGVTHETDILEFLQHGTLVGLLPVPHAILIRKYQTNSTSTVWYTSFIWGVLYLKNITPPIWFGTNVKLFRVRVLEE